MASLEVEVKKYITSLLTSTPLVVTMQQLNKDYINTIGIPIPYQKLGYNSLEHFLRSITDTVQVKGSGPFAQVLPCVTEKSAHINQLVTNQKVIKNKNRTFCNSQKRGRQIYPAGYNPPNVGNRASATPFKSVYYPNKNLPATPNNYRNTTVSHTSPSINKTYPSNYNSKSHGEVVEKQTNVLKDTRKSEDTYKSEKEVRLEEKPAHSTPIMANSKLITNLTRSINPDRSSMDSVEDSVPHYVRNDLRALIRQCPEGIWCAEIPEKYRTMFRRELNYEELGFKSLIHLCVSLPSIFHFARPSTGDYRLYDKSRPLPNCAEKTYTIASYSKAPTQAESNNALPNLDWADVKRFLPSDIFMPGEEIPRMFVPHDMKEHDNVDVVIGEIYDPSKFWVYLDDTRLETLMDNMQEFYREHAEEYLIPEHLIKEGIYCVQVIFGEYHRALIVDTMPTLENNVRVIFFDFGTMLKVPTKGLCFLHVNFSTLPAQAIRCRLANLFPLDEGAPWCREACKAFRRLVMNRSISAKISHINWEDQHLEVYLADVTDEDNIFYINDKLVEQGFARLADQRVTSQSTFDPVYMPIVKHLHLFPTFLELEHGLAPSTAEMEVLFECNVPINFCYPQYFSIDYTEEEKVIKAAEEFYENHLVKIKRRAPFQLFHIEQFKNDELDLSIFGSLEADIVQYLNQPIVEEQTDDNEEEFADADEDFVPAEPEQFHALSEQFTVFSVQDERTVNALKQDLEEAERIMNEITRFETTSESGENLNCTVIKNEPFCRNDTGTDHSALNNTGNFKFANHPLSMMTFEEHSPSENEDLNRRDEPSYDLHLPDFHLDDHKFVPPPEDDPLESLNRLKCETERKINNLLKKELSIDLDVKPCTNPFLQDSEPCTDLNPNNPFLTYLQQDDASSEGSSASTVYESPALTQHSWSSFGDMSAETISELGKSLRSKTSSSDSEMLEDRRNCSTQTSNLQNTAVQVSERHENQHGAFYQQPYYPPWSASYNCNPYYSVRFQSYMYESQMYPKPPGLAPPPGFYSMNRFPAPNCFVPVPVPMPQGNVPYAAFRAVNYATVGKVPGGPVPAFPSAASVPPPLNAAVCSTSRSSECASAVRENKDFYEVYNEQLKQKFDKASQ